MDNPLSAIDAHVAKNLFEKVLRSKTGILVRMTFDIFVSVDQTLHYPRIDTETPWTRDQENGATSWPDKGQVEFKDYGARYRPGLGLVIRDIDICIKSGKELKLCQKT